MDEKVKIFIFSIIICILFTSCCTIKECTYCHKSAQLIVDSNKSGITESKDTAEQLAKRINELECELQRITSTSSEITNTSERIDTTVEQLKDISDSLGRTSEDVRIRLECINRTSESIENTIERVIYLFGEYEQLVNELLSKIDGVREEITY